MGSGGDKGIVKRQTGDLATRNDHGGFETRSRHIKETSREIASFRTSAEITLVIFSIVLSSLKEVSDDPS